MGGKELSKTIAVFAFVKDDSVLMEWRPDPPFNGAWSVPGGRVEGDETIGEAFLREVQEELGVKIFGCHEFSRFEYNDYSINVYERVVWSGDLPKHTDAGHELRWIPLNEYGFLDWPPAKQIVKKLHDWWASQSPVGVSL